MKRLAPTIQELLAFDALARYQSMTLAAQVLCMSASAISKQISRLESFIGQPLVVKKGRGLQLTAAGKVYWHKITPCLRTIESATLEASARDTQTGILTLASAPTFLTKWLIPRLSQFRELHPGVTFSFNPHLTPLDIHTPDTDVAIRYGTGQWPNVISEYIAGREFVCIYATSLGIDPTKAPADVLFNHTRLHHEEAPNAWPSFAKQHHIEDSRMLSGPRFAQYSALIQAVLSGLGIGLVPWILIKEEWKAGILGILGHYVEVDQGHYLSFYPDRLDQPIFTAFRSWILSCTEQETPPRISAATT